MILTVTLNAAIDRTLAVPNFEAGFNHRAVETLTLPGGRGINVARVVKTLGQPVIATGFAGGRTGDRIIADLNHEGILSDFVRIEAESRTSTAVLDPTSNTATEINEYGPLVTPEEVDLMHEKLDYLAKAADVVVLAGSLPQGVDPSIYAEIIKRIKKLNVLVLLDSFGDPLRLGVKARPDVVFPRQGEAEEIIGYEFSGEDDFARASAHLRQLGARSSVISHRNGCVGQFGDGDRDEKPLTLVGRAPRVEVLSAVSFGDALIGGYAAKLMDGGGPHECMRLGLACAAANSLRLGAGVLSADDVARLAEFVELEEITLDGD